MDETKETSNEVEVKDLATEALEAAEDSTTPAGEAELQAVPVAKHIALRKQKQAAELEAAELRGKVSVLEQQQTKQTPAEKSPLDLEIERQAEDGIHPDDMTISPKKIRGNEIWKEQVANKKAQAAALADRQTKQVASSKKAMEKHEDWKEVVAAADGYFTPSEVAYLQNAGMEFGEKAYEMATAALKRANPETKTELAPKPDEPKPKEEKVPTQKEILDSLDYVDPVAARAAEL